ncbi:hypothetical protein Nmel_001081, partial [Mimus melanotis]
RGRRPPRRHPRVRGGQRGVGVLGAAGERGRTGRGAAGPARPLLSAGLPAEHRRGHRRHPGVAQPVPGGPGEWGAAARPCPGSRSPGPWPRGLLPPRRRLPALQVPPVPGAAVPGGWGHRPRAEALRWAPLQQGRGSRGGSRGGRTRARVSRAGPGAPGTRPSLCRGLHGAPEKGHPAVPSSQGVQDEKGARASSEGKAEPSWKRQEFCRDIGARPRRFPELVPVPLVFLPPAALDPAERVSAELPAVHGVQRGAGAGHRPHGAQPGHTPGQGLQQLGAASGRPRSHRDQRLSLQHHAHLRE